VPRSTATSLLKSPIVFEDGDKFYFVGPVAPVSPSTQDIEEYAFGREIIGDLKTKAPNEHLAWFAGHYVEADNANLNGAMWRGSEIAVKSLTPMFMPVTVMHDPRTAVGVIADLKLHTPPHVPRAKIDTALALWKHRFPEVVEEAEHNYEQGTLMQSMECLSPDYECSDCGAHFHKLPEGAEREQWCDHLAGKAGSQAARILRSVVFTGTGLIYGSRGAQGADPHAYLDSFQAEVAEFHQKSHVDSRRKNRTRRTSRMTDTIELDRAEYDRLKTERDAAQARVKEIETERDDAVRAAESAEADKVKAEERATAAEAKVSEAEEQARQRDLADERWNALGTGFVAKLGDSTKTRLQKQAASMSDEDWTARLEEIEDLTDVKRDAKKDGEGKGDETARRKGGGEFSDDEIARSRTGGSGSDAPSEQSPAARRRVVTGLFKS
jgi:hypothetical protein